MISFNQPVYSSKGIEYMEDAIINRKKICGDGYYSNKCKEWFERKLGDKVLLTTSCTHALEMAALLADIGPGDEVIMPSYTFVSTANAFVIRGAKIKFVDIRKDTMNIDENLIEQAITSRTKAIVPVHYAGVGCEMDTIMDIAKGYNLAVIEDAAQGMMATYKGKALGTFGRFGTFSFHETKNYTMGEGGLILIRDEEDIKRAEVIREKGTDRKKFFRGEVDKYSWVDIGSSYLPSEMNAAYLYAQLEDADKINKKRCRIWNIYRRELEELNQNERIELPYIPDECRHNAHMFYIKTRNTEERAELMSYLKENGIAAVFHYVPLHSSQAGMKYGEFVGQDKNTTTESERLLRLPLFYDLTKDEQSKVIETVIKFYKRV